MEEFFAQIRDKAHLHSAVQVELPSSDGMKRWVELRWIDVPDNDLVFLVIRDLTSYKTLQEELLLQALTDELTGLYNRRGFRMMAEQELRHNRRLKSDVVLLSIDIDSFKQINDTYGHDEGDRVLKLVAKTLQTNFRSSDVIGRWGGDEFLVLALDAPSGAVESMVRRFCTALETVSLLPLFPSPIRVTVGSAYGDHNTLPELEVLIREADRAMYLNKRR